jgi:hypothetical protein
MRTKILLCSLLLLSVLASAKDRLYEGESLQPGQMLMSPNGLYTFESRNAVHGVYRADGGLVRSPMGQYARFAAMQGDGNFVTYYQYDDNYPIQAMWSSGTGGRCPCTAPAFVELTDDGNLTIAYEYRTSSYGYFTVIWSAGADPAPLTTKSGREEYGLPPGPPPAQVPNLFLPSSYVD